MKKLVFILVFILSINIDAQETFTWLIRKQINVIGAIENIESTIAINGNQIYDNKVHPTNVGLRIDIWQNYSIAIALIDSERNEYDISDDTLENFSIVHQINGKNVNTNFKGVVAGNEIFL